MIYDFFLVFDVFFISGMGPAKSIAFPYNRAEVGGQDKKGIPEAEKQKSTGEIPVLFVAPRGIKARDLKFRKLTV